MRSASNNRPRLSIRRLACAAIAIAALIDARLRFALSSDASITAWLMNRGERRQASWPARHPDPAWLEDFAWALNAAARRVPFRADCIVRVLAAERVLTLRGWAFDIRLEAGPAAAGFAAHASLACGGVEVTGGGSSELATLVAPDARS